MNWDTRSASCTEYMKWYWKGNKWFTVQMKLGLFSHLLLTLGSSKYLLRVWSWHEMSNTKQFLSIWGCVIHKPKNPPKKSQNSLTYWLTDDDLSGILHRNEGHSVQLPFTVGPRPSIKYDFDKFNWARDPYPLKLKHIYKVSQCSFI